MRCDDGRFAPEPWYVLLSYQQGCVGIRPGNGFCLGAAGAKGTAFLLFLLLCLLRGQLPASWALGEADEECADGQETRAAEVRGGMWGEEEKRAR